MSPLLLWLCLKLSPPNLRGTCYAVCLRVRLATRKVATACRAQGCATKKEAELARTCLRYITMIYPSRLHRSPVLEWYPTSAWKQYSPTHNTPMSSASFHVRLYCACAVHRESDTAKNIPQK